MIAKDDIVHSFSIPALFNFQDRCQVDFGHKGIIEKNGFQFFFSWRPSEFPGKIDFFIFYYQRQTVNVENDLEWT